jgi:uncharacterized protein YciI
MTGFLLVLGFIAAILFVFVKMFRSRVARRMQGVELPAELANARQAAAPATPARAGVMAAPVAAAPKPQGAPHFLLIYDLAPDYLQRRAQFREEHLTLAWKAVDGGELVLGGALEEPTEQAFLLFRGTRDAALRFAAADPYVKHGLVKAFRVKQWLTVAGTQAHAPLRPQK